VTQQQLDRIRKRISDIKGTLAAQKRKYGGYDDGRGLRYLPTSILFSLETIPADWHTPNGLTKPFLTTVAFLTFYLNGQLYYSKALR